MLKPAYQKLSKLNFLNLSLPLALADGLGDKITTALAQYFARIRLKPTVTAYYSVG